MPRTQKNPKQVKLRQLLPSGPLSSTAGHRTALVFTWQLQRKSSCQIKSLDLEFHISTWLPSVLTALQFCYYSILNKSAIFGNIFHSKPCTTWTRMSSCSVTFDWSFLGIRILSAVAQLSCLPGCDPVTDKGHCSLLIFFSLWHLLDTR